MAVSNWRKPGISQKERVKILTADPTTRKIEAQLKDRGLIQIAVWEVPAIFVWPQPDEWWTIYKDSGAWVLGSRMEVNEENNQRIEDLNPGEGKVGADVLYTPNGSRIITVPAEKPTVTGSRGGNLALASLLSAGETLGLWTDATTV